MAATPEYVSQELFEKALREFFSDETIEIVRYASSAAIPPGENYTSDLFRTSITYTRGENDEMHTLSAIVKCSPENEITLNMAIETRMFENEIEMFTKTLPALNDTLGTLGPLSGKCIYTTDKPKKLIIFEDLCVTGFSMLDRLQGFDLEHSLFAVENIAKLHAASLVIQEKDPTLITTYKDGLFAEKTLTAEWIERGFNSLIKACGRWPGYEKYSTKLKTMGDKILTKSFAACKPKLGSLKVLNHGDAWINNFMFSRTPDGMLKDFRFVDFQLIIHTTIALDLHYFFVTSPAVQVKKEHLDTILDRYYASLLVTLTKLKYSLERIPTRRQILKEFYSRAFCGLLISATCLPLIKSPHRKDATFDDLMGDDDDVTSFRYSCFNHDVYRQHMEFLLPFYDRLGALDPY